MRRGSPCPAERWRSSREVYRSGSTMNRGPADAPRFAETPPDAEHGRSTRDGPEDLTLTQLGPDPHPEAVDRPQPGHGHIGGGFLPAFGHPLRVRAVSDELLDAGGLSTREVEENLADLARLNRLPGGRGASLSAARRLVGDRREPSVVDVGAGRGDIAIAFARAGWQVTAVDRHPDVFAVAERVARSVPGLDVVAGDARAMPFDDRSFDVAHASLLLHHLDPDEAVASLRELTRIARHGVVVNDLRRGLMPLAATWAVTVALARSHVTRIDGLTSVRRAYTVAELDMLLRDAGLRVRWRSPAWLPRVVTAAAAA